VLLTALAAALCPWAGRDRVLVHLEGHGREELFDGVLAGLLGADVADHLLSRNFEGIVWYDYPMVGFVLAGELEEALAKAGDDRPGDLDEDDAEVIDDVLAALRKAAGAGQDVVTVYA